jgi:hypothetical protein
MTSSRKNQTLALVVAWLIVGVPLAWGVWQVFVKSLDLFK